jgi:WhiB family redox-sensing transcriptional regulator
MTSRVHRPVVGLDWQDHASCAGTDPDAFFPERGAGVRSLLTPKRVCARCDVQADCLDYALEHDERFGIWGGMTAEERDRLTHHTHEDDAADADGDDDADEM